MKSFFLKTCSAGLVLACFVACQTNKNNKETVQEETVQPNDTTETSSTQKPKDIIRDLYTAINQKDYKHAYNLWAKEGAASDLSFEKFAAGYQETDTAVVQFTGNAKIHGAAGSLYAEVPVRIESQSKNGTQQVFSGHYVLRKSNIEPQKSNGQWHIYDSTLKQQ